MASSAKPEHGWASVKATSTASIAPSNPNRTVNVQVPKFASPTSDLLASHAPHHESPHRPNDSRAMNPTGTRDHPQTEGVDTTKPIPPRKARNPSSMPIDLQPGCFTGLFMRRYLRPMNCSTVARGGLVP